MNLTIRLLEQLKNTLPKNSLEKIFTQMAKDIAADQPEKIKKFSIEQKLDYIKSQLNKEGFIVEWEKVGEDYRINEVACPFYHVGQSHPEVCTIDQALISTILSIPTEKVNCVLNGDIHCTYVIKHESLMEKI
jgi:predicted ArsR family transcriptional regulator